jgi:hypothetical protein
MKPHILKRILHLGAALLLLVISFIMYNVTELNQPTKTDFIIAAKYESESCRKGRCHMNQMVSFEHASGVRIDREVDVYTFMKIPEGTAVTLTMAPRELKDIDATWYIFFLFPLLLGLVGITWFLTALLAILFDEL